MSAHDAHRPREICAGLTGESKHGDFLVFLLDPYGEMKGKVVVVASRCLC